MHKGWNKNALF